MRADEDVGLAVGQLTRCAVDDPACIFQDQRKLFDLQIAEILHDLVVGIDPRRIEADSGLAHGNDEQQVPAWGKYAFQFSDGLEISVRIGRITVTAQADVFDRVHARQGLHRLIGKRQVQQVAMGGSQIAEPQLERTPLVVINRDEGGDGGNEGGGGRNVDVFLRPGLGQYTGGPRRVVQVMGLEGDRPVLVHAGGQASGGGARLA